MNLIFAHNVSEVKEDVERLAKFNGGPGYAFYLHLKKTEFRFNHRHDDLYHEILKLLRLEPF